MNSKERLTQLDTTIGDIDTRLLGAIKAESEARAEYAAANDRLKLFRRELRQAKAEAAVGDAIDLEQFERPSIDSFNRFKHAEDNLETATAAVDLLRERLKTAKAERSDYVTNVLPSTYHAEYTRLSAEVIQTLARLVCCYATSNRLASGTVEIDKLVRIIARGNPLNLTGAADQLRADFGA